MDKPYFAADLHIHTKWSGCPASPSLVVKTAVKKGLDAICITDHDTISGGRAAQDYVRRNKIPLTVVLGQEVLTDHGDILAIGITHPIKKNTPLEQTLEEIGNQGGVPIAAHPFFVMKSLGSLALSHNLLLETYNATGSMFFVPNKLAEKTALEKKLPFIANSDAHFPNDIGAGHTLFANDNIVEALLKREKTEVIQAPTGISTFFRMIERTVRKKVMRHY